ncbi:(+)-neomenthol dehydrogenase isoform X4 [Rhodamnia argentea]|uniref:(+)-neomenthol dehydrogenase isoform X4 n=1 Tax=Rhodamnia argentea TaxID=178133 RepID=A0ABM3HNN1_9MYRT|nr:(+)-neomenthol dehydrogenase isoform X4 [Rhodamnia argentea]
MGGNKERARERREQRLQEISLLRTIPYSDHQRWWSKETIAVVTGSNRGIGFEIARQLAAHGLTVVLTSRDECVGQEATRVLREGGLDVAFHQLDVLDPSSIQLFVDWIRQTYEGIHVLRIEDLNLRRKLGDLDTLTEELIDRTVATFLQQVDDGTWTSGGWPQTFTDYSVSKLAVNAYTRLMAKILSDRPEGEKIYVNCYCPGWVKTAMTGWAGNISVEDGADTGVWLALLPDQAVTGKFFAERREICLAVRRDDRALASIILWWAHEKLGISVKG